LFESAKGGLALARELSPSKFYCAGFCAKILDITDLVPVEYMDFPAYLQGMTHGSQHVVEQRTFTTVAPKLVDLGNLQQNHPVNVHMLHDIDNDHDVATITYSTYASGAPGPSSGPSSSSFASPNNTHSSGGPGPSSSNYAAQNNASAAQPTTNQGSTHNTQLPAQSSGTHGISQSHQQSNNGGVPNRYSVGAQIYRTLTRPSLSSNPPDSPELRALRRRLTRFPNHHYPRHIRSQNYNPGIQANFNNLYQNLTTGQYENESEVQENNANNDSSQTRWDRLKSKTKRAVSKAKKALKGIFRKDRKPLD